MGARMWTCAYLVATALVKVGSFLSDPARDWLQSRESKAYGCKDVDWINLAQDRGHCE
jgi:hypothetical protein